MIRKERLVELLGEGRVFTNEPMSKHITFKVGGPADYYLLPKNVETLVAVINYLKEEDYPYYIIGKGSDLLVLDEGYPGAIISTYGGFDTIRIEGMTVYAEAGALMSKVAASARDASIAGFEFASGIPGTIGGGAIMNAGAYGGELKDLMEKATVLTKDGRIVTYTKDQFFLGYRCSSFFDKEEIVLSVELTGHPGDPKEIGDRMKELNGRRKEKQPLEYPSAGSTFKRPEGYFAGKLIQDAGLSGYRVGGAQVSEKHNGFVINTGDATAADILTVIEDVKRIVYEKFQVKLEPEVKILRVDRNR